MQPQSGLRCRAPLKPHISSPRLGAVSVLSRGWLCPEALGRVWAGVCPAPGLAHSLAWASSTSNIFPHHSSPCPHPSVLACKGPGLTPAQLHEAGCWHRSRLTNQSPTQPWGPGETGVTLGAESEHSHPQQLPCPTLQPHELGGVCQHPAALPADPEESSTHGDPWVVAPHCHVLGPGGGGEADGQDGDRHHEQRPHKPKGGLLSPRKPFWKEGK